MHLGDRLARGDTAAFAELYDACADRLYRWLLVRLGSREDAADVVQETFVRLARSRDKLSGVENLIAYVFQTARNESARLAAKLARESTAIDGLRAVYSATTLDVQKGPDVELLAAALCRLPAEQREVVELKAFGGLTLREIAEVTGQPPGTAATRYRTAIEKLRGCMEQDCHD